MAFCKIKLEGTLESSYSNRGMDPLVRGMDPDPALDPDPSVIKQNSKKSAWFLLFCDFFLSFM